MSRANARSTILSAVPKEEPRVASHNPRNAKRSPWLAPPEAAPGTTTVEESVA